MKAKILINLIVLLAMASFGTMQSYAYSHVEQIVALPKINYVPVQLNIKKDVNEKNISKTNFVNYVKPMLNPNDIIIRPKPRPEITKIFLTKKEINCMAINIYHEARNQNDKGQQAVGWVTINRVASGDFPDNTCKVVYQGVYHNGKIEKTKCQFSWYCDGKTDVIKNTKAWHRALANAKIVAMEFNESRRFDPTRGATMYHAKYSHPNWSKDFIKTAVIGQHIFYKKG